MTVSSCLYVFVGEQPKHFIYLTTWAETALNLHLIASFFTCLYGYLNGTYHPTLELAYEQDLTAVFLQYYCGENL